MDLCLAAARRTGSRVSKRWWDQDRLDLEGMRTEDWEAELREGVGRDRLDGDVYGLNCWGGYCSKYNLRVGE